MFRGRDINGLGQLAHSRWQRWSHSGRHAVVVALCMAGVFDHVPVDRRGLADRAQYGGACGTKQRLRFTPPRPEQTPALSRANSRLIPSEREESALSGTTLLTAGPSLCSG